MTHDDFRAEVDSALVSIERLIRSEQLLDIALETGKEYTDLNFDRILLLLDAYRSFSNCDIDSLRSSLRKIKRNLRNADITPE